MQATLQQFLGPEYAKIVKHQKLLRKCIGSPFFDLAAFTSQLGVENSKEAVMRLIFSTGDQLNFQQIKLNMCRIFGYRVLGFSQTMHNQMVDKRSETTSADPVFQEPSDIPLDQSVSLMSASMESFNQKEKIRSTIRTFDRTNEKL